MVSAVISFKVKAGKEKDFEDKALAIANIMRKSAKGLIDIQIYKNVEDPRSYLIYMEWDSLTSLMEFPYYSYFKDIIVYGEREVLNKSPKMKILG